jgi:hypothetical protein
MDGWSARRKASTCTQTLNIHALSGIGTHGCGVRASEDTVVHALDRSANVTGSSNFTFTISR